MKRILAITAGLLMMSAAHAAILEKPQCQGVVIAPDGRSVEIMECRFVTDDAGSFSVFISSGQAQMRLQADGTLRAVDLPGLKDAARAAFILKRGEVLQRKAEEESIRQRLLSEETQKAKTAVQMETSDVQ